MVPLTRASATRIQAAAKQTTDCHLTKTKFSFQRIQRFQTKNLFLSWNLSSMTVRMKGVGVVMAIKIQLQTSFNDLMTFTRIPKQIF